MTTLAYPLPRRYPVTRPFGDRSITRVRDFVNIGAHTGIDIGAPGGTPILAAAGGIVEHSGLVFSGGGIETAIRHDDRLETFYNHQSVTFVRKGQAVNAGQPIGAVGATGAATGNHLHFEVKIDGNSVDPAPYIGEAGGPTSTLAGAPTRPRLVPPNPDGTCPAGYERGFQSTAGMCVDSEALPNVIGSLFNLVLPSLLEPAINIAIVGGSVLLMWSGLRTALRG